MILGYHLGWTTYGWWFPNDPRGSWSREVWVPELRGLAERHLGRRPVQPTSKALRTWLAKAQTRLRHPPVILDGHAAKAAAMGIKAQVVRRAYRLWALAVMPDHVHIVVGRHRHAHESIVAGMKAEASKRVRRQTGLATGSPPDDFKERRRQRVPIWTRGFWVRLLNSEDVVRDAIRYVELNPVKIGLARQRWSFVVPFDPDGWDAS